MKIKHGLAFSFIILVSAIFLNSLGLTAEDCENCGASLKGYPSDGCTVVLVGKDASTDGSVMSTHTCDCSFCDWTFRYVPAADHPEGTKRKIYHASQFRTWHPKEGLKWEKIKEDFTGLEIDQPERTFGYIHGMFGYMNDNQVAIGESTIGCRREMRNPTPSAQFDLTHITLLAMERAETARDAIKIMGHLGETYGYGFHDDGEMLAVSDPEEIWIFEIMPVGPLWTPKSETPGAVWCAQRVPDDHVSVCPNESRIGEIDLNNPDYFMASSNVVDFAVKKGWYDPESGEPFNWKKAYSPVEASAASSRGTNARMWRFYDIVAPSLDLDPATPNMELPFSVKPDKKLSAKDVMEITRDKYQGTPFDPVRGIQGGPFRNPNYLPRPFKLGDDTYNTARTIGVNRAEYTTVTQCRGWLPDPVGGLVWISFGAQDTACYMPFYVGVTAIPHSFEIGDHWIFDRESARWAFDYVDFHTQVVYDRAIEDVKAAIKIWEDGALARTEIIDSFAEKLLAQDRDAARQFLTDYCLTNADRVVKAWWELGDFLLVKYNHLWIYDPETRKAPERLEFPEWWLQELVKYDKLVPQEKRKE